MGRKLIWVDTRVDGIQQWVGTRWHFVRPLNSLGSWLNDQVEGLGSTAHRVGLYQGLSFSITRVDAGYEKEQLLCTDILLPRGGEYVRFESTLFISMVRAGFVQDLPHEGKVVCPRCGQSGDHTTAPKTTAACGCKGLSACEEKD